MSLLCSPHVLRNRIWIAATCLLVCAIVVAACGKAATPRPTHDAHRSVTAAESFPVAQKTARAWREDALWYGVVPFTSMERAFAIPLADDSPSWYFRFGIPGGETEYIVEVLNGKVRGTNETKIPSYVEPPLAELEPLGDQWVMMDSIALLEKYLEEKDSLLAKFPSMVLDYRLTQPKGQAHPVWTLYNAQNLTKPIFIMDAITGETLPVE